MPLIDAPDNPMESIALNVKLWIFFRKGAQPGSFSHARMEEPAATRKGEDQSRSICDELTKVPVVGRFELVFDDDRPGTLEVTGDDVAREFPHRLLRFGDF
jgi:hypothetical protein